MSAFLWGLLGAVVGVILLVLLAFLWLKRKFGRLARELGAAFAGGGVPPFRITLERNTEPQWRDGDAIASVSKALTDLGYLHAGDFDLPEMPGVILRGLVNPSTATLAALYEHPGAPDPKLDMVRLHADRQHTLVTTLADDGLDVPANKIVRRFETPLTDASSVASTVSEMHQQLLVESGDRKPLPVSPKLFTTVFSTAYATEMDWRIARGGVTADEVRRVAVLGGQESPSDDDVETVCLMWRQAIDDFVTEQAQKSFLATGALSAADWESLRERVLVVHEHSVVDELVEDVSDELLGEAADEEDDDYDASVEKLSKEIGAHLTGGDPVSGFRNARAAVPALARFEHLGDVTRPWRAALYIRPDSAAAI